MVRGALSRAMQRLTGRDGRPPAPRPAPPSSAVPTPSNRPARGLAAMIAHADRIGLDTNPTFSDSASIATDEPDESDPVAAPDRPAFWGPVNNESARARAAGHVLRIDQDECIACGTCVEHTDTVYDLRDGHKATVISQDGPMDRVQGAIDACPVACIEWHPPEPG